ncbi:Alpha-phospholipase A2 inhibitor clone 02/03/06/07 [Gossypium arboreum]|uniref:Alpha-phospholipase A2 inhibitor clone 02/03/06/07 n=1 Tax=Gossypium arboreum TaxID=29729 RepID=A0A0B0PF77_GOSAR|nr:Alpha-phospholipase A2 inhibitor clone 02/03/06/07 [Gossypium arboreum]
MSTIENVLIQIFERKNRIIDNVKQQILLFDHQLASKCLIDGFVPPPWLLSSSSFELNTDDLISGLLLPHSQQSIPYCSLYQQPVVTTDNVQLPHVLCSGVGVDASNEGLDKFLSGKTDQLDPSVTSPQDCRDGMVSDICPDPCLSLTRIQRSKSRQRALEHRNSAKVCKNVESFDKNDDACNSQNKVSKIASLMSGPVDKLELIRSGDNVVSYEVEKEERGQCRSKERSEYFYSGRVTRSSSVQPSKSMGGPSGAGNTSCVAEQYEVAPMESICKSGQHHVSHEFLEPKVAEPVDNTESCLVKNEARGPCWSQERGEDICSGGITRSRSSVHPPMSVNCPPSAESINKSRQQPDAADELLQFVKPVENVVTFVVAKQERDQYPSKERGGSIYSGRVTRSRSSVRSPNSVDGLLCVGKPSEGATCDENMLIECISRSKAQPDVVDKSLALVRPTVISNETCGSRKARDHRSKERGNNVYQGRLTRSRSSSQYQTMENDVVDQYNDGSTGSRPNHSVKLFKLDSSNTLENKVRQSKSTSSNQFLYAKSSERSEGVELSSGTQVDSLPCIDGSGLAELNQCDAFVAETDANSGELVEASASSASNLDGGNNPSLIKSLNRYEGVELEVIGKSQQSSSAIKVLPKQLDFIDLGDCTVKEASSLLLKSENMINSLDKSSLTPFPCADNLDEVTSVHYQETYNSSHERQLPEKQEDFSKEEKPSETAFSKTSGGRISNLNVLSSVKGTPEKTFMEDLPTTSKVCYEALHKNLLQDGAGSNIDVESGMDYLFEKDNGKVEEAKSVIMVRETSHLNFNTDLCGGPPICSPPLLRVGDASTIDAFGHPCAALFEETTGQSLKEKMESSPQNQDEVAMGRCIAGDTGSVLDQKHAKSSDKVAVQSIRLGKHSRSHVEGSWSHKRRKVDGQQSNSLSLSLNLKEEDAMQLNAKLLVDEEQIGGKYNRNERGRSENTPSNFIHKQFDVASVSSSPLANLENFDQSEDAPGTVYPSSIMFDSTRKCTADENQIILNVGDNSDFANIEHLACDERSKKESKCHLGEDGEFSTFLISSPCRPPRGFISADQSRPELEGFIIQTEDKQICNGGEGIGFEKLHLSNPTIERASLLEQLCKSACTHTPLPQFPTTCRMHQATGLYQSVPKGLLECMDLRSTLPKSDDRKSHLKVSSSCFGEEANCATSLCQSVPNGLLECMDPRSTFPENSDSSHLKISSSCFAEETNHALLGGCFSDCLPLSSSQLIGNVKNPYLSPVGKFWDRITSNSDSSEKRGSLKLELPCINEENENMEEVVDAIHFQEGTASKRLTCSAKRVPLAGIMECPNAPSVSGAEIFHVRDSLDSVNTAYSFIGTENGIKQKVEKQNATKRRDINKSKENCSIGPGMTTTKRASESLRYKFSKPKLSQKTNPRKGGPSFSEKELKLNNIVSNVTTFIPLVQQKQAASIATGKRDVKVKALEAAEAAKKLAEKKENDRKMKKEALKLERVRLEQENLRQLELEKKKKEERKKKEADMAAKKRQREEEERLEKERKRKRIEEARRQRCAPEDNLCSKKDGKEKKCQAPDERAQTIKVPNGEALKLEKMQRVGTNEGKMSATEISTAVSSTTDAVKTSTASEDFHAKAMSTLDRAKASENNDADITIEQSYDISPYKGSDDEEEDDDENEPNRKFVPPWVSKNHVAWAIISQQKLDPEAIFPPESFCSISQVLLPRKLQQHRAS